MERRLPSGWRSFKLKDVCREITVGHVGPMANEYVEEGFPFLRSQNILPFRLELTGLKYISKEFHKRLKKSAISAGDVVVVRTGYPGTACVVPPKLGEANCADLVIIRPTSDLDPWFAVSLFDRFYNAEGESHRELCEVFGAGRILDNLDQFLGWFMVRKVIAPKVLLKAAGTVMKHLASWMGEKGYVKPEEARDAAARGAGAARDLPKAEELASCLSRFAETQGCGDKADEIEDHFTIVRIEPGATWLYPLMENRKIGPVRIPEALSRGCKLGWQISGVVGRIGREWRLAEAWNVYPQ